MISVVHVLSEQLLFVQHCCLRCIVCTAAQRRMHLPCNDGLPRGTLKGMNLIALKTVTCSELAAALRTAVQPCEPSCDHRLVAIGDALASTQAKSLRGVTLCANGTARLVSAAQTEPASGGEEGVDTATWPGGTPGCIRAPGALRRALDRKRPTSGALLKLLLPGCVLPLVGAILQPADAEVWQIRSRVYFFVSDRRWSQLGHACRHCAPRAV